MCLSSSYSSSPTPSVIPGATNVSTGKTSDSDAVQSRFLESLRKKRGYAATIKNEGGAAGVSGAIAGKTLLGE